MQKFRDHRAPSLSAAAHFELWCTSLVFMTAESSCKCWKWREGNQIRAAKQTWSEQLPSLHTSNSSREISPVKDKKSTKQRSFGKFSLSLFGFGAVTSLYKICGPNFQPRRQKPPTRSAYSAYGFRYFCKDHTGFSGHKISRVRKYKCTIPRASLEVCPWWKI